MPFRGIVDLLFLIDTTASMEGFIEFCRQHMLDILKEFSLGIDDLKCGLVEYRDHPDEDSSFVTKVHRFGNGQTLADYKQVCERIRSLKVAGGGDLPEAVYDGIYAAATEIKWRLDSKFRIVFLIGDAPPQGNQQHGKIEGASDYQAHWPNRTPNGIGPHECASAIEAVGATIFAVPVTFNAHTMYEFKRIALLTGGQYRPFEAGRGVRDLVTDIKRQCDELRKVSEIVGDNPDPDTELVAETLGIPLSKAYALVAKLR